MVSSSSNNSIQKSKSPIIHTKIIVSLQVPYKTNFIPLIFLSSSFSSPLLHLLLPFSSLFFSPYPFLPIPKDQNDIFILVLSLFDFNIFPFCIFGPQTPFYLHFHLFKFLLWHTIFCSYVIWVLNWKFTNLPLTFVLISGFVYFIFSIILFRKIYIYFYYTLNML